MMTHVLAARIAHECLEMSGFVSAVARCAAVLAVVAVSACETPAPTPQYPEITFKHLDPIRLDVADIEYVQAYVPPQQAPNVEHLFPVRLSTVARRWADERIQVTGVTRVARVTLVNASVVETKLEKKTGLVGAFTTDQSERYDGTVEMRVEIVSSQGVVEAQARAVANRSRTVPEDITLNERDQVWFEMTEALMRDLDAELELTIRRYLARFVR